jgi:hypothetical protein
MAQICGRGAVQTRWEQPDGWRKTEGIVPAKALQGV